MSVLALRYVRELRRPPTQKLVLFALADMANDYGEAWPAVTTLAQVTGLSERGLQGAIKALIAAGIMSVKRKTGQSSRYFLALDGAASTAPQQDLTPAGGAPPQAATPAPPAPPQEVHPAGGAPHTPQEVRDTPAGGAPRSLKEGSKKEEPPYPPPLPAAATAAPAPAAPAPQPKLPRGSRVAADFAPNETGIAYAKARGLSQAEVGKFVNYWTSVAGSKALKADWQATWRTWCDKQVEFGRGHPPKPAGPAEARPFAMTGYV